MSLEEILATTKKEDLTLNHYDQDKYLLPFWETQIIYNEPILFLENKDGDVPIGKLMYKAAKVLEVRDSSLKKLYVEGVDYDVVAGSIKVIKGSSIPIMKYNEYYLDTAPSAEFAFPVISKPNKFLKYAEGDYFHLRQISVTYIRTEKYSGITPEKKAIGGLEKTIKKLKNKEDLTIVYYGDSVMYGCNNSGFAKVEPNMPILSDIITQKLENKYGYKNKIRTFNTAVGGWTSENGKAMSEFKPRVLDHNPDLVVIRFGGNDGTWNISKDNFGINLDFMIKKLWAQNPNAEILLMSPFSSNDDVLTTAGNPFHGIECEYRDVINEIAEAYNGVAHANITDIDDFLLSKKNFIDLTSNNINHPNDFYVRIHAQVALAQL